MRPSNQRKLRNYLLDPKLQLSYALYFFTFSVIAAILNQMMLVRAVQTFLLEAMVGTNVDATALAANIAGPLRNLGWRLALLFPVVGLACALFAIRLTHRFVGPQRALRRHITALKQGDFSSVCHLRSDDELKGLAADLNDLAAVLREREASMPETDTIAA